jgi:protein-S-isoprenylcysteine O-methyltransferase Ste14
VIAAPPIVVASGLAPASLQARRPPGLNLLHVSQVLARATLPSTWEYWGGNNIQKDHHLVTGGPYRVVRHPSYLGALAMAAGLALTFRSWIGLALLPPFAAILAFRIRDEEALMRQEFEDEWDAYCRRTRRVIPLLY